MSNQSSFLEGCLAITPSFLLPPLSLKLYSSFVKCPPPSLHSKKGHRCYFQQALTCVKMLGYILKDGPFPSTADPSFQMSHYIIYKPTYTYCMLVTHTIFLSIFFYHIISLLRIRTLSDVVKESVNCSNQSFPENNVCIL